MTVSTPSNGLGDGKRILSVQSHVSSGYVGNKAATFPLQYLGFEVDAVNTVNFSNHTGYGHTSGYKTTAEQLDAVFAGLSENGLISDYTGILSGYIPSAEALQVAESRIAQILRSSPRSIYLLDPVMGDIGRGIYVSESVIPVYRSMLRMATIITPNHLELELLSDTRITSLDTLRSALSRLHQEHDLPHIVVSSIALPRRIVRALNLPDGPCSYLEAVPTPLPTKYQPATFSNPATDEDQDELVCIASTHESGELSTWAYALPTVRGYFAGVGDLFSAMVLAHFDRTTGQSAAVTLQRAVSQALLIVQRILLQTHIGSLLEAWRKEEEPSSIPSDDELDAKPLLDGQPSRRARRMRLRELRIIPERRLLIGDEHGWSGVTVDWADEKLCAQAF